jgi:hypothetical protein
MRDTIDVKSRFQLRLGDQSKEAGDERNLSNDSPFFHPMHLPLHYQQVAGGESGVTARRWREKNKWPVESFSKFDVKLSTGRSSVSVSGGFMKQR